MNIVFSYINLFGNYIFQNLCGRDVNGEKKNFGKQRGGRAKVERARHSGNSLPASKVKYRHEYRIAQDCVTESYIYFQWISHDFNNIKSL